MAGMIRQNLWIQGMIVESAAAKVEDALRSLRGVEDVRVRFEDAVASFAYDPRTIKLAEVIRAVRRAGYAASQRPPAANRAAAETVQTEFAVGGMTCAGCETRIENRLNKTPGVVKVTAKYASGTVRVRFDPRTVTQGKLIGIIAALGYQATEKGTGGAVRPINPARPSAGQLLAIGVFVLVGYMILKRLGGLSFLPNITANMGYGLLFAAGLMTSLHCVAMCGGINLSQSVAKSAARPSNRWAGFRPGLLYNAGRVVSYTALGGVAGALGGAVSLTGAAQGVVAIIAGVFMVLMALSMLQLFPSLRSVTPRMPKFLVRKLSAGASGRGPFYVGLLNGLMPCGPLQAMQLYALGTGSPLRGALAMLFFSAGTLPLMLGFSAVSSLLSRRFTHRMMKAGAALVLLLGVVMLGRGFSLSGIDPVAALSPRSAPAGTVAALQGGTQTVTTQLSANRYPPVVVQTGVPVRWIIRADAASINGCNSTLTIPEYGITRRLVPGDNEIAFTPKRSGSVRFTCSMGMISSTISVVDDLGAVDTAAAEKAGSAQPSGTGMPCCG